MPSVFFFFFDRKNKRSYNERKGVVKKKKWFVYVCIYIYSSKSLYSNEVLNGTEINKIDKSRTTQGAQRWGSETAHPFLHSGGFLGTFAQLEG